MLAFSWASKSFGGKGDSSLCFTSNLQDIKQCVHVHVFSNRLAKTWEFCHVWPCKRWPGNKVRPVIVDEMSPAHLVRNRDRNSKMDQKGSKQIHVDSSLIHFFTLCNHMYNLYEFICFDCFDCFCASSSSWIPQVKGTEVNACGFGKRLPGCGAGPVAGASSSSTSWDCQNKKTKHSKTTPTTPTATLLSCLSLHPSSCIPCSKKFNEQEQTLKSKTATLLEIFIHSSHLRCPSARSKMSSMLSTIRLKFFRSSRGFSTSLAGNLLFCRLRRVRTQNWEILRSKLFASIEAFFSVWASESGTMQRCVHHKMLYT